MRRMPLPVDFAGRPFRVRDARSQGIGEARLYNAGLARPTHGVRIEKPARSVTELAQATAVALPPDAAFSGVTAAAIHRLRLPNDPSVDDDLEVMRDSSRARIRRRGCMHRKGLQYRRTARVDGLHVTDPVDTWYDLAPGMTIEDLVVIGDSVAERLDDVQALHDRLEARRVTDIKKLRRALRWVRLGSRSHMESRGRLAIVWSGLPEPELNVDLKDVIGGWIGCGDMVWESRRVVVEYQGQDHFTPRQGPKDIARRSLALENGWTYLEMVAGDFYSPARRHGFLTRLAECLGRPVDTQASWRPR